MSVENAITQSSIDSAPIHRLPDEILGAIFFFNTLKEKKQDLTFDRDPYTTTFASAQVCHRWRAVALEHSALWSRVIDYERHKPPLIEQLLSRSKKSVLDVGENSMFGPIQLRSPRATTVLKSIFEHTSRLRTFSLSIRLQPWNLICKAFLQFPAPSLEYLNLITQCPFPDCIFFGPLFADEAPRLRSLNMQRCLVNFSSLALFNLTSLSVFDILRPRGMTNLPRTSNPLKIAPTGREWLLILQNMPALRYLTLANAISPSGGVTEDTSDPPIQVALPRLALLTISGILVDDIFLINNLTIPLACGIRFRLSSTGPSSGADSLKILSVLGGQLSEWPLEPSERYLQAKILSGNRIHFGNSRRIGHIWNMTEPEELEEHAEGSQDPLLWLILTFETSVGARLVFNSLLRLYDRAFPATTSLDLWLDQEFANTATNSIFVPSLNSFHSFTGVTTLNLLEQSPMYLLPLFQHSSPPSRTLFPTLCTLCLTGLGFEDDHRAVYDTIIAFLLWRIEIKKPLTNININELKISKANEEYLCRLGSLHVSVGLLGSVSSAAKPVSSYSNADDWAGGSEVGGLTAEISELQL